MDAQSLQQLKSFWPDVAGPFSRVIPEGCYLVHTTDTWSGGQVPVRVRVVDLARHPGCPPIGELIEEAVEDAERRGWTPLDHDSEHSSAPPAAAADSEHVLELEDVLLRIGAARVTMTGGVLPVLRVSFEQKWPSDAGPPVETSEMFQNLVRKLLRIGSDPAKLVKDVTVDLTDLRLADVLRELVLLKKDHPLDVDLAKLDFRFDHPSRTWVSETTSGTHIIAARVRDVASDVEIEMTKRRIVN
jgi:hypothetical protein